MKLSNQQINAIVFELSKESALRKENEAAKDALYKDKKIISDGKKFYKKYMEIPSEISNEVFFNSKKTEKDFIRAVVNYVFKPKKCKVTDKELRQLIIIESIDCKNIDELRKKVTLKM